MNSIICLKLFPLLAHPGHGTIPAEDPAHYVFEPVHAFWGLLALGIVLAVVLLRRRFIRCSPVQAVKSTSRKQ